MKIFNVERKKWRLFRNMYASISDKIYQEIILKVDDVCALANEKNIFFNIPKLIYSNIIKIQIYLRSLQRSRLLIL